MRLVGASNGFIRGPFLMEGALHAIIGVAVRGRRARGFCATWRCRSCRMPSRGCPIDLCRKHLRYVLCVARGDCGPGHRPDRLGARHASLSEGVALEEHACQGIPINLPTWRRPARKARARNIKLAKLFSLIIVVAAAFVGGFAVRGRRGAARYVRPHAAHGYPGREGKGCANAVKPYNSLSARVGEVEDVHREQGQP